MGINRYRFQAITCVSTSRFLGHYAGLGVSRGPIIYERSTYNPHHLPTPHHTGISGVEKPQLDIENSFFDIEKPQLDIEKPFLDVEKPQLDIENSFLDIETRQLDIEKPLLDIEKPQLDIEISFFDIEKRQLDIENPLLDIEKPPPVFPISRTASGIRDKSPSLKDIQS